MAATAPTVEQLIERLTSISNQHENEIIKMKADHAAEIATMKTDMGRNAMAFFDTLR